MYRIAADLAGVMLTRPEMQVASKPVKAEIVDHERNDNAVPAAVIDTRKKCVVQ